MRDFLAFIQPENTGFVEIRCIKDSRVKQYWEPDRQAAVDLAIYRSDQGWDAYYGVLPRLDHGGSSDSIADKTQVLWADIDPAPVPDTMGDVTSKRLTLEAITGYEVPPSVVVDSGNGYHAYWRLYSDVSWESARYAMIGIAKQLKGDHVYDKPRILRIPGTVNWKDPLNPRRVRTIVFNTTALYRIVDFVGQIEIGDAVMDYARRNIPRQPGDFDRKDIPVWLEELIEKGAPQGSRSEQAWKVMCSLIECGWSDHEIKQAFEAGGIGDKMREQRDGERWFLRSLSRARASAR